MPCWRQRDAYSREENVGSQLRVLPHCYVWGVTGLTDAFQQAQVFLSIPNQCGSEPAREGVLTFNISFECKTAFASRLAPTGFVSICSQAFQPDERARSEQFCKAAAIGQAQIHRCQFRQWIQHKGPLLHMVVRDFEARFVDQ